jgi:hypothetical protein
MFEIMDTIKCDIKNSAYIIVSLPVQVLFLSGWYETSKFIKVCKNTIFQIVT